MYFILASSAVYLLANARVKENQSMFAKVIVKVKVVHFSRLLVITRCWTHENGQTFNGKVQNHLLPPPPRFKS